MFIPMRVPTGQHQALVSRIIIWRTVARTNIPGRKW
jgi:hypothetical protein